MKSASDPFDLKRFVYAQAPVYRSVVEELRAGRKRGHWMWFVFPQLRGLGSSPLAVRYGISSLEEAQAYLHDVLNRLKPGIVMCREKQDTTSAVLLEKIVADEEEHIDYLETQLELMDKLGEELYSAQCVSRPPT